jgi:hypothetical protein
VAVLEKLEPENLQSPSVALYYGVLLAAAGETGKAAEYLGKARKGPLLPEEKVLLDDALKPQSEKK